MSEWNIQGNDPNEFVVRHNHDREWVDGYVEETEDGELIARCPLDDRSQLFARDQGDDATTIR
jgi:hypothetical protein